MLERFSKPSKSHSFFLFGARGTGKTTLLNQLFADDKCYFINLLNLEWEERLASNPQLLYEIIEEEVVSKKIKYVVIDEIQKIPSLLDVVHAQIEKNKIHFALTGSSARKLKRGGANLLAGRAITNYLFPLTSKEIGDNFDLHAALTWGTLPTVLNIDESLRADYLRSYVDTYLKEEIIAEQIIRKVQPFRQFLQVAAQSNCKIINFSKMARDIQAEVPTVQNYFEILEDTLLGFNLPAYETSVRKRVRKNPKFYFFDCGVQSALSRLLNIGLAPQTSIYGDRFEQFLINEIRHLSIYKKLDWEFSYFTTKDHLEIDLVIDRPGLPLAFIEIKSSNKVSAEDYRHLLKIKKDISTAEYFLFSQDILNRVSDGVHCLHWKEGLKALGF